MLTLAGAAFLGLAVSLLLAQPERRLRSLRLSSADVPPAQARCGNHARSRHLAARWWWSLWRRASRQDVAVAAELPLCLDLMAACLEAGISVRAALFSVGRVSGPSTRRLLSLVGGQLELGRSEVDAWRTLVEHPSWGPVARDVARSSSSGTALVLALRAHAAERRRSTAWDRRKLARAAGVRAVLPLALCFLPAFVLAGVVPIVAGLLKGVF